MGREARASIPCERNRKAHAIGQTAKDRISRGFFCQFWQITKFFEAKRPRRIFLGHGLGFFSALAYYEEVGGWMMRLAIALALPLLLVGCATVKKPNTCDEKASFARGIKDAQGGTAISSDCSGPAAWAYRAGYDSRKKRQPSSRNPAFPAWVCEVEASAKVFTGVGASADEASRAAQKTCSTHFQASSCLQTECTRSL